MQKKHKVDTFEKLKHTKEARSRQLFDKVKHTKDARSRRI